MSTLKIAASLLLPFVLASGQTPKPTVSVKEVHPEPIPKGDCIQSESGYLEKNDGTHTNHYIPFTENEIGQYIASRMKHGYVVTVYPQVSGRVWVMATCGPNE